MTERTNGDHVPAALALIAARLGTQLRDAGVPAGPGRCERFARAVPLTRPATHYELYLCALATFASGPEQTETVRRVFSDLFGGVDGRTPGPGGPEAADLPGPPPRPVPDALLAEAARAAQEHPVPPAGPAGRPSRLTRTTSLVGHIDHGSADISRMWCTGEGVLSGLAALDT